MATRRSASGSRFAVDLGDLKLPSVVEKRVEAEIQAVVLRVLAEADFEGRTRLQKFVIDRFPDGTLGMIFNPDDAGGGWPPWGLPTKPRDILTVEDHTLIVRAVMERPFEVIQYMNKKDRTANPSPTAVLEAALQVDQIDSYTKDRISIALDILPRLDEARENAPADLQRSLDEFQGRLARGSIDEQIDMLRSLKTDYRDHDGLTQGVEFAAQMLEDGRSSIYSPDFPFYRMLREGKRGRATRAAVDDIKNADTIGAAIGGGIGVFVGGVGAGPGAAATGGGASAGAAIGHAIRWLLD
jgi:hypothetical protein